MEKLTSATFKLFAQDSVEQRLRIPVIRNDDIGADAEQTLAFPLVNEAGAVDGLVASNRHRQAANLIGLRDIQVTISEGQKLRPAVLV